MGATTSCAAGAQRMHYLIASLPIALYALALILGLFNVDLPLASPFQLEIGAANLAIGLGAIAATILGLAAAWAIFFVAASFLWGAAAVHISDMVRNEFCNQYCRSDFLVEHTHAADIVDRTSLGDTDALTNAPASA